MNSFQVTALICLAILLPVFTGTFVRKTFRRKPYMFYPKHILWSPAWHYFISYVYGAVILVAASCLWILARHNPEVAWKIAALSIAATILSIPVSLRRKRKGKYDAHNLSRLDWYATVLARGLKYSAVALYACCAVLYTKETLLLSVAVPVAAFFVYLALASMDANTPVQPPAEPSEADKLLEHSRFVATLPNNQD